MKIIKEFKEFAVKGNMVDIAIGVIIGSSFNNVVNVIVKKIILPPLTYITSGINLKDKKIILQNSPEIYIGYGELIEAFIDFGIVGISLFIAVKIMNKLKDKADDISDTTIKTPKNIEILSNIAELIKTQNKLLNGRN